MLRMEQNTEARWVQAVAQTLRAERGIAGLSQAEAARRADIARTSYRLYEEGKRQPDTVQLVVISRAFGVSLGYLISEMQRRAESNL